MDVHNLGGGFSVARGEDSTVEVSKEL